MHDSLKTMPQIIASFSNGIHIIAGANIFLSGAIDSMWVSSGLSKLNPNNEFYSNITGIGEINGSLYLSTYRNGIYVKYEE